ncbi:MAG TPA: hypothetical protein PLU50_11640, partial [Pseudobdellovibrionaceae bacterium]|nr:hypothetical protein [Pseudobdellovibrionaceae bacterium]
RGILMRKMEIFCGNNSRTRSMAAVLTLLLLSAPSAWSEKLKLNRDSHGSGKNRNLSCVPALESKNQSQQWGPYQMSHFKWTEFRWRKAIELLNNEWLRVEKDPLQSQASDWIPLIEAIGAEMQVIGKPVLVHRNRITRLGILLRVPSQIDPDDHFQVLFPKSDQRQWKAETIPAKQTLVAVHATKLLVPGLQPFAFDSHRIGANEEYRHKSDLFQFDRHSRMKKFAIYFQGLNHQIVRVVGVLVAPGELSLDTSQSEIGTFRVYPDQSFVVYEIIQQKRR